MSLFKISKSSNKTSASKSISSAQSTPRSSLSLDGPSAPAQNKSTSSAGYYKTLSMAYAISR
ncbi:hypothetical protein BGZ74_000923, partial [Mortierella antarctica]